MSVFQRQTHLTAGTVIDAENLPHMAVCRTSGVFLSQLRDGFRVCPCQLLHQALPAVLALVVDSYSLPRRNFFRSGLRFLRPS